MLEHTLIPLFAIPFYASTVPVSLADKTRIKNEKYKRLTVNNGDITENTYLLDLPQYANLKSSIMEHVEFLIREHLKVDKSIKFEMKNSWATKHYKTDWADRHQHSNSLLSGILYIETEQDSGDVIFEKDLSYHNLFPTAVDVPFESRNVFNSKTWSFTPEPDRLFIFPSHLVHRVTPSNTDKPRYCVAFNFFPVGTLGLGAYEKLGVLELK